VIILKNKQELNLKQVNKMEKCKFMVWNYKYNKFLPCEIINKHSDKLVEVIEYHEKDGEIKTVIPWSEIKNNSN